MIEKLLKFSLISLFFLLPLINSHLFDLFWIKWWFYVDWNYEFTKVIFFNILSWIILTLFFIKSYLSKTKLIIPKLLVFILIILIFSTQFSEQIYTSLLWNSTKSHSMLMFINLIWLFILFINSDIGLSKKLIKISIYSLVIVLILWLKEYYLPTFEYWNLENRAFSTFWHPNYLILFLLILSPFLIDWIKNNLYKIILFFLIITIFLTKSIWWILIFILYIWFRIYENHKEKIYKKHIHIFIFLLSIILWIIIYKFWFFTKLNSFLSRFYIWETTYEIIFSDTKNILIWSWLATLENIFNWFKSPELYIFENIWFRADRPHNLLLNFFYHFWIFWLSFIIFLIYNLITKYKNNPYFHSLILFFIFTVFNFSSISHYLLMIIVWTIIYKDKYWKNIKNTYLKNTLVLIIISSTIFWIFFSWTYYYNEYNKKINSNYSTNNYFLIQIQNEDYKFNLLKNWIWNIEETCTKIIQYQNSVENNFYCWNILRNYNENQAIKYYNNWLKLLPDMWNENSKYYDNIFIKNIFIPERFYSEKFSNLKEILKRVWEK